MAVTAVPPVPSPWWDIVKTATPYIGQVLVIVATFAGGYLTNAYVNKPRLVIAAADPPRPAPMVAIADLDHLLGMHEERIVGDVKAAVKQLLDERLPLFVPKGKPLK